MKAIILCAGYATRLYPLTLNTPKPLLPIAGRPLLDYTLDILEEIKEIDEIYAVTNAKFKQHFLDWSKTAPTTKKLRVFNDASVDNDSRLGAVQDLKLVIDEAKVNDDILVLAGDNIFHFSIKDFVSKALQYRPESTIAAFNLGSKELASRYGVIDMGADNRVADFLEKPAHPPSALVSMGLYFFPAACLKRVQEFLDEKQNADAPGFFVRWLIKKEKLRGYAFEGVWYDIGDFQSYENANKLFANLTGK